MNESASQINLSYVAMCRKMFNEYVELSRHYPAETLQHLRPIIARAGMLVEIWATIEKGQKERNRGY